MKKTMEQQYNAENERMKYKYRIHKLRAKRKDIKTVTAELKHIRAYEIFTGFDSFACFDDSVADRYIKHMDRDNKSLSYRNENLKSVREFLVWLLHQRGYKSKINYNHTEYLHLSSNEKKEGKAPEYKRSYTFEQIFATIRMMPSNTAIEKRNKAMISFQALCGLRVGELRTVKLKNLIEEDGHYFIYVSPRDMSVKFAKTREANFMPLPDDIKQNVLSWVDYLKEHGFAPTDPIFSIIPSHFNQYRLLESHIVKQQIKSDTTIRDVFKKAFHTAGYDYLRPHSFRHTIVRYAEQQSPEFLNAVRQSLGHSSIDTTFQSYGELSPYEQRKRIEGGNVIK